MEQTDTPSPELIEAAFVAFYDCVFAAPELPIAPALVELIARTVCDRLPLDVPQARAVLRRPPAPDTVAAALVVTCACRDARGDGAPLDLGELAALAELRRRSRCSFRRALTVLALWRPGIAPAAK